MSKPPISRAAFLSKITDSESIKHPKLNRYEEAFF